VFESIVAREPEEAFPYSMLGSLYLAQGDDARSLALFEAALVIDERDLSARVGRAEVRLKRGERCAAWFDLQLAARADPAGSDPFARRARRILDLLSTG